MNHFTSPDFWEAMEALPDAVRKLAERNFEQLKSNPKHPSLHFKNVGRFWSVRVGIGYRALAVRSSDDFIWFWIGRHADYDRLLHRS